jgi:hypothetical protein
MKKLGVLLMTLLLSLAFAANAFAFTDLGGVSAENQQDIDRLVNLGILNGYEDGTFQPAAGITRAEFAKVATLVWQEKTGGSVDSTGVALNFSDVKKGAWYDEHISKALKLELLKGDAEGTFRPNDNISLSEVVTVALRILGYSDADLQGTWPSNYLDKAVAIGLLADKTGPYQACSRVRAAALMADVLDLAMYSGSSTNAGSTNTNVAVSDYGVVIAATETSLTMNGFLTGLKTYSINSTSDLQVANPMTSQTGQLIYFTANSSGLLLSATKDNVYTNNQHEATIASGKITLNGKSYTISDSAIVQVLNSAGGVSIISVDKLLESNYVASLRSSSYYAPIQYVLSGSEVTGLLIGDYKGQSELHFGYIEEYGQGGSNNDTLVQFYGDSTDYVWNYIGKEEEENAGVPAYNTLYAYTFNADGVRAYKVKEDAEEIKDEVVKSIGTISLTEKGNQFIVDDDTVIISVEYDSKGEISKAEYVDEVEEGDIIRVRYVANPKSSQTGLEAAYIIIDATDK